MSLIPSARSWATLSFPRVSGDEPQTKNELLDVY